MIDSMRGSGRMGLGQEETGIMRKKNVPLFLFYGVIESCKTNRRLSYMIRGQVALSSRVVELPESPEMRGNDGK